MYKKVLLALVLASVSSAAYATVYPGNGNTAGFGGAVGNGSLTVTNDGSGGLNFSFTLANSGTTFNGSNNDLVIYFDNGSGLNGVGASTANLNDAGDNSRQPVSEFDGTNRSTLNFGGFLNPQYGFDFSLGRINIFSLASGTNGNFSMGFVDGVAANSGTTGSTNGVTYTISGSTFTADIPAVDFGLSSFSGQTVKFMAINISNTGFSSNEATVTLTGNQGYTNTQTVTSVDTFTIVPEPASVGLILGGAGLLAAWRRSRMRK